MVPITADGVANASGIPIALPWPMTLFWNGKNYVTLQPAIGGFYGMRITSQGVALDGLLGGGVQSTGPMLPGAPSGFASQPMCDANGCYMAGTSWKEGTVSLFTWRVVDGSGAFDHTEPSLVGTAITPGSQDIAAIVLPGPLPRVVYSRVAPEALNVGRIFIRTEGERHRAVGH